MYINLKIIIKFEFAYNLGPIRAILSKFEPIKKNKNKNLARLCNKLPNDAAQHNQ